MLLMEFVQSDAESTQEAGVIRNVLVLGSKSRNRREYKPDALRKAAPLYENVAVYADHPTSIDKDRKGRAAADRFGVLKDIRFVESAGGPQLRGDLHYLTTHPLVPRVEEDRQRGLNFFGLSHLADGTGVTKKGTNMTIVESIDRVTEVDLVTNPATAMNLMEQEETAAAMDAVPQPTPEEEAQAKREEAQRKAEYALTSAIESVLVDPDMPTEGKKQKIAELVATHFKQLAAETKDESEETPAEQAVEAKEGEIVAEQAATLARLSEQVAGLSEKLTATESELKSVKDKLAKPRKWLPPHTEEPAKVTLAEQTVPTDKAAAEKWWHSRD